MGGIYGFLCCGDLAVASSRDPHRRRPIEDAAVGVQRRSVPHGVAGSAAPAHMASAAVSEASDMADEDLIRAEWVSVRGSGSGEWVILSGRGLYELPQHILGAFDWAWIPTSDIDQRHVPGLWRHPRSPYPVVPG